MLLPRLKAFEDGDRLAIAIDPDAAGSAVLADAEVNFVAIHAQNRMIMLRDGLRLADDVMSDHGAAEAISAAIGVAAVRQLPVEEERISGRHDQRDWLETGRQFHRIVDETDVSIGIDCAENRNVVRPRYDKETTVFFVAAVDRHPGGDAGARLDAQIELILMQRLTARPAA